VPPANDDPIAEATGGPDSEASALGPALRERLDFEALITDISARVVVATPETMDQALLEARERLRMAGGGAPARGRG
jgi:hypothetical protein